MAWVQAWLSKTHTGTLGVVIAATVATHTVVILLTPMDIDDTYTYPVTPHLPPSVYPLSVKPYVDEIITLSCCIVVLSLSSFLLLSSFLGATVRSLFVQSVCDCIGVLTPNTCNLYHHGIFFPRFSAHHCITTQQPAL